MDRTVHRWETRHLTAPGKGSNKTHTVYPEQLLAALSCPSPSISIAARRGPGRELEHCGMITCRAVCQHHPFGATPLIHSKVAHSHPFLSLSLFLINSLELPGAVGCCRADKSHFRPVLALKGGRRDECVLGTRSPPLPATWGWQHPGHLPLNLLGLHHPTGPSSP